MNINPNQIQKMMKQMGMQQEEIDAEYVIIKTPEHKILINDPQITKVNMMGQDTYQIVGDEEILEDDDEEEVIEIDEDDLKLVMEETGATEDEALDALEKTNADIAEAILILNEEKNK
ncbi:MAG: nascent polypeptide-associated complex protein [Candidatus Nanoarchaeia archaeon]|nr:nascent polypeptide-associated complex protein [Candidatus Nanoarchaeia archaeon]